MIATPVLLAAALAAGPGPSRPAPDLRTAPHPSLAAETRCGACHTEDGWTVVRFAHERTGFALDGRHVDAGCKACHPAGFASPVPAACGACHRDPHAGELGGRCGACHDAASWSSRFGADAHRRTSFPLSGRHAFVPCQECHGNVRDRAFARAAVDCGTCHQADLARASAASVDHVASGFDSACQRCHSAWRFDDGVLPEHDACFLVSAGPHAGTRCLACHTRLGGTASTGCSTGTAACTRCHGCGDAAARHASVLGFDCKERKCYECHRFATR